MLIAAFAIGLTIPFVMLFLTIYRFHVPYLPFLNLVFPVSATVAGLKIGVLYPYGLTKGRFTSPESDAIVASMQRNG